jgi:hypothetical protein
VESQQVVLIQTRAADRWLAVETTMTAVPVVVVKPGRELSVAFLGVEVGADVDPLTKGGLDEPFGFAVGARV